jgi:hypothetical protein
MNFMPLVKISTNNTEHLIGVYKTAGYELPASLYRVMKQSTNAEKGSI